MKSEGYWQERYRRLFVSIPALTVIAIWLCIIFMWYIMFYTRYWYLLVLYVIWIFTLDRKTCETGGRSSSWLIKNLPVPNLPFSFKKSSPYELDPSRNYMLCCFPHAVFPIGLLTTLTFEKGGCQKDFPRHRIHVTSLHYNYFFPFVREILLAFNILCVCERSLNYLLNDSVGGKAVAIFVGGSDEMIYAGKKDYHIFLKRRKGFARVALKNGSPLIPVLSFGETNVYNFPRNAFTSVLNWMGSKIGFPIEVCCGQGIFQDWFGFFPLIKPITVVAGEPIDVVKNENPTREDVEELHANFTAAITHLFNDHKHKYLPDADNVKLIVN